MKRQVALLVGVVGGRLECSMSHLGTGPGAALSGPDAALPATAAGPGVPS